MTIANLEAIIKKIRKLSASPNSNQLTDSDIVDYINSFYLYDFPSEFRSLDLKDVYTFNTIRGIDTYPFDKDHWINVQEPCYIAKRASRLFYDAISFYYFNFNSNGHWQREETLTSSSSGIITNITQANPASVTSAGHGLSSGNLVTIDNVVGMVEINGLSSPVTVVDDDTFTLDDIDSTLFTPYVSGGTWVTNAFIGTLQATPILRSVNNNPMVTTNTAPTGVFPAGFPSVYPNSNINRIQNILITANLNNGNTLHVTDNGGGFLVGDIGIGANTINYETGEINVAFSQTLSAGTEITVLYTPVVLNIPLAILFFQNQFVLRPVPDKGYTVEIVAYRTPSQALLGTTSDPNLTGRPELLEWWETIAVGAAKKIYEDRLDMEGVAMMDKILQERYQANFTRTYANLGKRRISTIYADQLESTGNAGPFNIGIFG